MSYLILSADIIQRLSDSTFIPTDPNNTDYQEYLKWVEDGNTPLTEPPKAPSSTISKETFWNRFTPQEQLAIVSVSLSNAVLATWLQTAQAADNIDLASPTTKAGLDALVAANLLTSSREEIILTP